MLHPQSESDVVDIVRATRESLRIEGSGTKRELARAGAGGNELLCATHIAGIVDYRPEELILTARAGTPLAEIQLALAEKKQRLGFDPPDFGPVLGGPEHAQTIAGVLSADCCGPARLRYGAARDHLLGIRAVNGLGEAFKAGGKVVKNVTGFDIPKLVCGAFGTLAILTEVTLRVFPKAEHSVVYAISGIAPEEGLAILRKVRSSPLEATGLAYLSSTMAEEPAALIRLEGAAQPLAEKQAALLEIAPAARAIANGDNVFHALGSGYPFVRTPRDLWRVFLPSSHAASFIAETKPARWYADWAGGLVWAEIEGGTLHDAAARHGGHALRLLGREPLEPFAPQEPARLTLSKQVKAAFDPMGLFNPGRMYDGL